MSLSLRKNLALVSKTEVILHIMKTFLSDLLKWFLIINTGIMAIVWINLFGYDEIWTAIFPQIFGASFLTSLVTCGYFSINPKKPISVPVRILLTFAHYLILCVIIMGLGNLFDWFELSVTGGISVVLSVAGVYLIATVVSIVLSKSEADEMTRALKNLSR